MFDVSALRSLTSFSTSTTAENFAAAAQICHDDCSPSADQRGPVDYKRHLARELTLRALTRSAAHARGEIV